MAGRKSKVPKWPEVKGINDYAVAFGCLAMATRGLGFLVVTWTTVVLLGGFVSILQKKDFWSLTVITFIQIAGVVDDNLYGGDKVSSIGTAVWGLCVVTQFMSRNRVTRTMPSGKFLKVVGLVKQLLGVIAASFQIVAYWIACICAVFVIFAWGPYIATGVSLWRLAQHDYGSSDGDSSKANMTPALNFLYIIVVVQGAIFAYTTIIDVYVRRKIVTAVAKEYGFEGPRFGLVAGYMSETRKGCSKNPSFAKERNLVTYAMDLTVSSEDYAAGVMILSTILGPLRSVESTKFPGQNRLIRKLILYAPSSHTFRFLLLISNPRNRPYGLEMPQGVESIGIREVRKHAANIVLHTADGVSPELLPEVIKCISSLIGTFPEHQRFFSSNSDSYYGNEEKDYLESLWNCLHVLFVLTADENNCRLIINTPGLLTKIMTPVASDFYHQTDHDACKDVLDESMRVMHQLTVSHGQTGAKLFPEIETNLQLEAVEMMVRTISSDKCSPSINELAMEIFTNLNMPAEINVREDIIEKLTDIYTYTCDYRSIIALEALSTLCSQDGSNVMIILQVNGSAVYSFTDELDALSDGYKYSRYHMIVAEILQHACLHCTRDDECFSALKESMTYVIPKVLKKIVTAEATPTGQQGGALQDDDHCSSSSSLQEHDNGQNSSSSSIEEIQKQQDIRIIETALLSLCVTVHETFISADQVLAVQFDEAMDLVRDYRE